MSIEKIKEAIKEIEAEIASIKEKANRKIKVLEDKRAKLVERQQSFYLSLLENYGLDELTTEDLKAALKEVQRHLGEKNVST